VKKIVILTSSGGGGTLSASTALEEYLKNDYKITTLHIFNTLLKPIDFCSVLTLKKYSCEDIYNILIPRKCFRALTALYHVGSWYIQLRKKRIYAALRRYFTVHRPDLIISVVPILNNIILSVAQDLNIPFLLIPTDLDVRMYLMNITQPAYKKFYIGIPFADNQLTAPLKNASISDNHITVIGAPLKHTFFLKKDISLLKKEFCIPENKPVIMLIMGAQGSYDLKKYAQQLFKITTPIHIIICTGKNNKPFVYHTYDHISVTTIQFTSRIADLMELSDIIITKSGSLSVCEAIYMNTPLILDATTTILPWERFNHDFVKTHKIGTSITHYADITRIITNLLETPHLLSVYKNNLQKLQKKNIEIEIKKCIVKIINPAVF